jgi:4-hydroxythreonine-4-phosphate dehydrogenase
MRRWLVTADDRTGAFEVAAELAAVVGPVTVTTDDPPQDDGVVDVGSRHRPPDEAARRMAALPVAQWNAHKIDSTLRGNWATEVRARARVTEARVLLVPAWPAMGRTCIGGTVHVHGAAVGEVTDGLPDAELLEDLGALGTWLARGSRVAAIDVADTSSMVAIAAAIALHDTVHHDLMVVGPAGPIGAAFAARFGAADAPARAECSLPALVVRGSATQISREQVARLRDTVPLVDALEAPPATDDLVPAVALELAGHARARMGDRHYATVVLIGGDTAAAVLGPGPREVGGSVAPGMPWSRDAKGGGPLVVTKAGGFGGPDALVDLFRRQTG